MQLPSGQWRGELSTTGAGAGGGWVSFLAQDGRQVLERVADASGAAGAGGAAATAAAAAELQQVLFERLRPLLLLRMLPAGAGGGLVGIADAASGCPTEQGLRLGALLQVPAQPRCSRDEAW